MLSLPTAALAVIICVASVAVALLALAVVHRWSPSIRRPENNDVNGVLFGMVGVVYAILMAFIVIVVWEQFTDAEEKASIEVTRVSNLLRDSQVFPRDARVDIRTSLLGYVESVVDAEWETMAEGKSSPIASRAYEAVWGEYYRYAPQTQQQAAFYDQSLQRLNELGESRRLRLLSSRASIPVILWILLIAGGVVTVGFSSLFWMESARAHAFSVASLAGLIGFVLFVIFAFEHPFAGDIKVTPDGFRDLLELWENRRL